jgi:hypothetical protein
VGPGSQCQRRTFCARGAPSTLLLDLQTRTGSARGRRVLPGCMEGLTLSRSCERRWLTTMTTSRSRSGLCGGPTRGNPFCSRACSSRVALTPTDPTRRRFSRCSRPRSTKRRPYSRGIGRASGVAGF